MKSGSSYLYVSSNNHNWRSNSVIAYRIEKDGVLSAIDQGHFLTGGEGINNNTHGKLGPNDNDTPLLIDRRRRLLFVVNGHSDSIAIFAIKQDGKLKAVDGSPFHAGGIMPNSLALSGETLLVSNRNEDYHRLKELREEAACYASFRLTNSGEISLISKVPVAGKNKPTQILVANYDPSIAFGNDFQVDADFDGGGSRSFLAGEQPSVQGQIHSFKVSTGGELKEVGVVQLIETNALYRYLGMDNVPSLPLGLWSHPSKNILYVGFVTRNELGVYTFSDSGQLEFRGSVPNSGQDICWLLSNSAGDRLYTINNLPRDEHGDGGSTVTTYDISGEKALKPVEVHRIELPCTAPTFRNNRNLLQPGSTAFQCCLSPDEDVLFVVCQRINQTQENTAPEGNRIYSLKIDDRGIPSQISSSRDLQDDGVPVTCRPQGLATIQL